MAKNKTINEKELLFSFVASMNKLSQEIDEGKSELNDKYIKKFQIITELFVDEYNESQGVSVIE